MVKDWHKLIKPVCILAAWVLLLLIAAAYVLEDSKRVEFIRSGSADIVSLEDGDTLRYDFSLRQDFCGVRVRCTPAEGLPVPEMTLFEKETGEAVLYGTAMHDMRSSQEAYYVLESPEEIFSGGTYEVLLENRTGIPVTVAREGGVSVYRYSNIPRILFGIAFFLFAGGLVLLYVLRAWWRDRPERFTMISLGTLGLIFILLIPGWCTADFYGHWPAVLHHANRISGYSEEFDYYLTVREGDLFLLEEVMVTRDELNDTFPKPGKRYYLDVWEYSFRACEDPTVILSNRASPTPMRLSFYSVWNYLPFSLVTVICRWLNMGLMDVMTCCRLIAGIFFLFCICHAIRRMPLWYGKWAIACFMLIPGNVKTLTAITYDAMVLVVTVNVISMFCFLNDKKGEPWRYSWAAELVGWCFLLGAVKGGGYAFFILLVPLLLRRPLRKKENLLTILAFVVCILTVLYYDVFRTLPEDSFFQLESVEGRWSISYAFAHIGRFFSAMLLGILRGVGDRFHESIVQITWEENFAPWWVSVVFFLFLMWAILRLAEDSIRRSTGDTAGTVGLTGKKERIVLVIVLVLMVISIPMSVLRDVRIESREISLGGGRYYLPLFVPAFLLYRGSDRITLVTGGDALHAEERHRTLALTGLVMMYYMMIFYYMLCIYLSRS